MNRIILRTLAILSCLLHVAGSHAAQTDVVVIGGTPGGIAAAVTAGRAGRTVILVEYHDHIGGMMASGLGKCDIEHRAMIGGVFKEFIQRVHKHYVKTYGQEHENVKLCRDGYYFEPSVAEAVFESLLTEQPTITILKGYGSRVSVNQSSKQQRGVNEIHRATRSPVDASHIGCLARGDTSCQWTRSRNVSGAGQSHSVY